MSPPPHGTRQGQIALHSSHREEVLEGLRGDPKTLSPKLFYDERGAQLFERIRELPEYYLGRAEVEILRTHASDISTLMGPDCALIEYGSGAGVKVRILLDALERPASYTPIDISAKQLTEVAASIGRDYPRLVVQPVCADYSRPIELPHLPPYARRRVAFFPGSTIGNFHPVRAISFLKQIRRAIGSEGALVLGLDRRKSVETLHAAYNDAEGVTAEFNLNVLRRLNRELSADFELDCFRHVAFYDSAAGRVEMHLESLDDQVVTVAGEPVSFALGETIWTESSYKYDEETLETLVTAAGFRGQRLLTDRCAQFWVALLT